MTKKEHGFTVIEIVFIVIIMSIASVVFFIQKNNIEIVQKDDKKKTAINAMYYSLEEVFYKENSFYPQELNSTALRSVDPQLFTDPDGININEPGCAYTYIPVNCSDNKCQKYTLKAELDNEGDYEKTSKN